MPTHDTPKQRLGGAVGAGGMPTDATPLAGVGRVDQRDRHARQGAL